MKGPVGTPELAVVVPSTSHFGNALNIFLGNQYLFVIAETTVKELARRVSQKLGSSVVRVVGDPAMRITKVAFSPGAAGSPREIRALEQDDVEVLMVGETREWETVEYAADAVSEGRKKALIVIGHIPSEQTRHGGVRALVERFREGRTGGIRARQAAVLDCQREVNRNSRL